MQKLVWPLVVLVYALLVWLSPFTFDGNDLSTGLLFGFLTLGEVFLFFALILWASKSTWENPVVPKVSPKVRRLAVAGLGALSLQLFLGAVIKQTQSGLACSNFPNCLDSFFPLPWTLGTSLTFFHRWLGILLIGNFFHLALQATKTTPALARPAQQTLGLSVAQVFLGIGLVLGGLHEHSRLLHAALGFALWGALSYLVVRSGGISKKS